ncbi:MAG: exo-beta-N-acetylmuramidase NamZ family protein [Ignavibacteria bacterium]
MKNILTFILLVFASSVFAQFTNLSFETGNTMLVKEYLNLLKDKQVGIITNSTGVDKTGKHIIDMLVENKVNVTRIFTPEHGFSADDTYKTSGIEIPVTSLYGSKYSFTKNDVSDVDVLIFDIQELGARFYTYTSTLYLTMQDAKKYGKEYIVCDRPSVADIHNTEGFMLDDNFSSFVGKIPTPVVFGLTIGELASYLNGEYVNNDKFKVIKMKDYDSNIKYENLMSTWINPSPSITSIESARLYPALCFLEGTSISEGRGTSTPFQVLGSPFVKSDELLKNLNDFDLQGISFEKTEFVPDQSLLPSYTAMKFISVVCYGVKLKVTDMFKFKPFETSVAVLLALKKSSSKFAWTNKNFIDKLVGTNKLRTMIDNGSTLNEIISESDKDARSFKEKTKPYLLY